MKGQGDLIVLEGEDTGDLFPNTVQICNGEDVSLLRVSFNSTPSVPKIFAPFYFCASRLTIRLITKIMKYYSFCYDMLYHHKYFKYIILFLCFQKIFKQDEWSNIIRRSLKVQIFWEGVVHWNHYLCSGALRH
jgi:hypothetical protein